MTGLTAADVAYLTDLGRRLEAACGLPEATGPTCPHRSADGTHCELPASHVIGPGASLHTGQGYVWGDPALALHLSTREFKPCPGCAERCGQCGSEEGLD